MKKKRKNNNNNTFLTVISIGIFALVLLCRLEASDRWQSSQRTMLPFPSKKIIPVDMISVAAVGDVMMSSWIIDLVEEYGYDFPFDSTASIISSADLAIANLEAPFTTSDSCHKDKTYTFKVPPHFVGGLKNAGFDMVTLANNHILDYGEDGLMQTMATLDAARLPFCGAGLDVSSACAPRIVKKNGQKIALVGFSMTFPKSFWAKTDRCGTCYPTPFQLKETITACEERADITIVSFHWGQEKRTTPKKYQMEYAHKAIDYGADLILGHHPHVLQGFELYKGKLIAYSLGNYVFGSYSEAARTSAILRAMIRDEGLVYASVVPINVHNATVQFQPKILKGLARKTVIDSLNAYSQPLNLGKTLINQDGTIFPTLLVKSVP